MLSHFSRVQLYVTLWVLPKAENCVPRDQRTEKNSSGLTGRRASLVTQMVKNPPARQEIRV